MNYVDSLMADLKPPKLVMVYPAFIAFTVQRALEAAAIGDDRVVQSVTAVHSLGNSVYGITCKDHHGTEYRITVEVK